MTTRDSSQTFDSDIAAGLDELRRFCMEDGVALIISISRQRLYLLQNNQLLVEYPVSTAKAGPGCRMNSYQTPTGMHAVAQKIGDGEALGEIFRGRQPQGEIAEIELQAKSTGRDCITSRILWLKGLEQGINCGGEVDSYQRYIYIHGTHEEGLIGQPASIGCVRMKNTDVIDLFDRVSEGTPVNILL